MSLIKDFELWRLEVPLGRMIGDNNCAYDTINIVALRLRTDDGVEAWGYGEACSNGVFTRPAWYIKPMASLSKLRNGFRNGWWPALVNLSADTPEISAIRATWKTDYSYLDAAARMALWDLSAQEAGVPLYQFIGGKAENNRVRAYGSIIDYPLSEEDATALARDFVDRGFKTIKVKVGAPTSERDLARLQAIRDAVGEEIELTADANEAWTSEIALQRINEFEAVGHHLGYMEDPLPHQDIEGFRRLTAASPIPIVAHDYIHTLDQVNQYCQQRTVDRLRIGKDLDFTIQSSAIARQHEMPVIMGNSVFEFNVHAAVALPNVDRLEFSGLAWNDLMQKPVEFKDGYAQAPEQPGHGLAPDMGALEEYSRNGED